MKPDLKDCLINSGNTQKNKGFTMVIYFSSEEIVEMGIKIEEMGEKFYATYAEKTKDEKMKDLFKFLEQEEVRHKETFQNILNSMQKGEFSISYDDEEVDKYFQAIIDSRIFSDDESAIRLAKSAKNEKEAVNYALSFEKDTVVFYYGFLDLVKEKTKDVVMKLIDEEKKHIKKLHEIKSEMKQ